MTMAGRLGRRVRDMIHYVARGALGFERAGLGTLIGRARVWRSHALPPSHLLRQVCESCTTYKDAKRWGTALEVF